MLTDLNSGVTKVKEPGLPFCLLIDGRKIVGFQEY